MLEDVPEGGLAGLGVKYEEVAVPRRRAGGRREPVELFVHILQVVVGDREERTHSRSPLCLENEVVRPARWYYLSAAFRTI